MQYKYSRNQIFGKRLKVPKEILKLIFEQYLSFPDFIQYELENKIPLTCVRRKHREIVEHFGLEKSKSLDWELLKESPSYCSYCFDDIIKSISPEEQDINLAIYDALKNIVHPEDYSPAMLEMYKGRYIDLSKITSDQLRALAERFNKGETTLEELVMNWDFFKDMDSAFCLSKTTDNLCHQDVQKFMESFSELVPILIQSNDLGHYMHLYKTAESKESLALLLENRIYEIRCSIVKNGNRANFDVDLLYTFAREFFEQSSVYKFLIMSLDNKELILQKTNEYLSIDHSHCYSVPGFNIYNRIRDFLDLYAVENIVQFDKENNHFFSDNHCYMLERVDNTCLDNGLIFPMLHPKGSSYSIDDFYEIMKQIILYTHIFDLKKLKSGEFQNKYSDLYISELAPKGLQNKFYDRELTLRDIVSCADSLCYFNSTNIVYGFSEDVSWFASLLKDKEKMKYVSKLLMRLYYSNSSEIFTFREELATQLLKTTNPIDSFDRIEDLFIRNNVPTVAKLYSCFEILHPDFQGFDFSKFSISPTLKKSSLNRKKTIVFSDLIKSAFASNNRSIRDYLKNIEIGSQLYENIKLGRIEYDLLPDVQKKELLLFSKHLAALYANTMKGKKDYTTFTMSQDVLANITMISRKLFSDFDVSRNYHLADRLIRMFCGFIGIHTLEQAKNYVCQKIKNADTRNRLSIHSFSLEQGDFIKGIGKFTYLRNILQNGCVSKEYLGSSAGSDSTPLDTDVCMISKLDDTIRDTINKTVVNEYGPIWIILKNDDRFLTTRTIDQTLDVKDDLSKMEVFYTGACGFSHYGIRTGFASSEINYMMMEPYDSRVGLEIAMNGFYIPVFNIEGQIVFTPNDYDKLRKQMNGLSYYDENHYIFSENLITEEVNYLASQIEQNKDEIHAKKAKINEIMTQAFQEVGLLLKTYIDGDLTEGFVELIDIGSTGRGTNIPGDGDFDFIMRLDKTILMDSDKLQYLKHTLLKKFAKENSSQLTNLGDFRLEDVWIDSKTFVDIDITFIEKDDKISYSTDMALRDRLDTIQKLDSEKYTYVIANILIAKQILKQAGVYYSKRSKLPQGGLGGVGIENWILQNGGSLIDAASSFIEASNGKSFEEFQADYSIWDFGGNHLAKRRKQYPHDNFVADNMNEKGYHKMVQVLKEYLNCIKTTKVEASNKKR